MNRRTLALPLLAALFLACAPAASGSLPANEVRISGFAFSPASLDVKAGTTVN